MTTSPYVAAMDDFSPLEEDRGQGEIHSGPDVEVENVDQAPLGGTPVDDHDD